MNVSVGCDAHRTYSQFAILDGHGQVLKRDRVMHECGSIREYLTNFTAGTPVALESVGNWYWIADEIESAGCVPLLTHAAKAKVMMRHVNKTDKLDAKGLAVLLHNGTLPFVWVPPAEMRDKRELHRTRMALRKLRVALKNRVNASLAKYGLNSSEHSDIFVGKGRAWLEKTVDHLPAETSRCVKQELEALDSLQEKISSLEKRIRERIEITPNIRLLKTIPGIADILATVIEGEVGNIERFPTVGHFCSYARVVPTVQASGGKMRYGHMRKQSNQYLKWAFIEAANVVVLHQNHPNWQKKHVTAVYKRIRGRKGHSIAVGAVARHLAEAAFWVLEKRQFYQEPKARKAGLAKAGISACLT